MTADELKAKWRGHRFERTEIPHLLFCEVLDYAEYWVDINTIMGHGDETSIMLLYRIIEHYKEMTE